jgi:hypothetical protein
MRRIVGNIFVAVLIAWLLVDCGGGIPGIPTAEKISGIPTGGGSSTPSGGGTTASSQGIKGIAVDPYVVGAKFCEDINNNGICDAGEQVSTASNASGIFYFQNTLTLGTNIIISSQGMHNGVAFTGKIKRNVDQADNLVVSPLTTLLANGWTAANVISVLQSSGGIAGLTEADLKKDPLAGVEGLDATTLTADHFKAIKSTLVIHSFLSIMQGVLSGPSVPAGGYNISYAVFNSGVLLNGQSPQWYVDRMVDRIGSGLDPAILTGINANLTVATAICRGVGLPAAPPATAGDIIRSSVAIADYVIPKVVNDLTYAPSQSEYGPWGAKLGLRYYLIRNMGDPCVSAGIAHGAFTTPLGEAFNRSWSYCKINSATGLVECF